MCKQYFPLLYRLIGTKYTFKYFGLPHQSIWQYENDQIEKALNFVTLAPKMLIFIVGKWKKRMKLPSALSLIGTKSLERKPCHNNWNF